LPDPRTLVQRWLQHCVLALDLCPFAAPVLRDDSLRIAVSDAIGLPAQLEDFLLELDLLQTCSEGEISTTLLVFSQGPEEFDDFLELVAEAESLVEEAGLGGLVQLAQFHPRYQFAGEAADGVSHYSNRSPLPVIHLIRESMMTRVLASYPDPSAIGQRNIEKLEAIGSAALEQRWASLRRD
jgi:hypothetical protein